MSMSTGGVNRPPLSKLSAKATATGGAKPDVIDSDDESTESTTNAEKTTGTKTQPRPGAKSAAKAATRTSRTASPVASSAAKTSTKTVSKGAAAKNGSPTKSAGGKGTGPARGASTRKGKGRKTLAPVRVSQGTNWSPILMFGGAGLVAVLIIGFAAFQLISRPDPSKWRETAASIPGIANYLESNADWFTYGAEGNHKAGSLTYPSSPPVGGVHNDRWQNCMGDVYTAEIAKEHAVHSLEHGAVWVTYRPDLPQDQIDELAALVRDKPFLLMSPYPGLDKAVSVQAWGYQLKADDAGDGRIGDFINTLRQNTTQEPGATCSGGITDATSTPLNLPAQEQSTG